ncbi:MAG: ZIP family metal transporter [Firmicutes bacterium]|nr:ZIP family metal transporter [Bacillota bacterium]
MSVFVTVALLGLLTGVAGTVFGGCLAALLGRPGSRVSSATLGFAGGVMLAIVGLNLFPEALRQGGLGVTVAGLLLGVGLIYGIDLVLPHAHANPQREEASREGRLARTALLLGLGVALHNLPEGIAVGSAFSSRSAFGWTVVALVFAQKIPEGLAVAAPYLLSGTPPARAVAITAMAGIPHVVGALIGAAVSSVSPVFLALAMAFSGGAMLFIVGDELLPGAHELASGHTSALGLVGGVLAGLVLSAVVH